MITCVTWDQAKMKTKPVKLGKEMLKKDNVDEDLYP